MSKIKMALTLVPVGLMALVVGCSGESQVSFSKDVQPILNDNCLKCHVEGGAGFVKNGLNMTSYENLMKGTHFGPVIDSGSSVSSTLVRLISGNADPSLKMPHGSGNKPLSEGEVNTIKMWIDQGAKNN
ncbi:MAG: hypothetical protein L3J62_10570 [Gammaproteobacteria bacterium]|nr:hypothetical protein [Gammaproteobacteria bacterium]MCF6231207.1 hypothetical protein [Gammaproteobacteria bacterium]